MATQVDHVPLTRAAFDHMQRELEYLSTVRRRDVAEKIRNARESEIGSPADGAPALEYAREDQGFVEGRIAELQQILARATIIDEEAARVSTAVRLGSIVTLENGDGIAHVFQLVGPVESNPAIGKLSCESPVGQAVMNRRAGDEVEAGTPSGIQRFRIKDMR